MKGVQIFTHLAHVNHAALGVVEIAAIEVGVGLLEGVDLDSHHRLGSVLRLDKLVQALGIGVWADLLLAIALLVGSLCPSHTRHTEDSQGEPDLLAHGLEFGECARDFRVCHTPKEGIGGILLSPVSNEGLCSPGELPILEGEGAWRGRAKGGHGRCRLCEFEKPARWLLVYIKNSNQDARLFNLFFVMVFFNWMSWHVKGHLAGFKNFFYFF